MKIHLMIVLLAAALLSACGGSTPNNANSNSKAANASSTTKASPSPEVDMGKDLEPVTMSVSEFMRVYERSNEGRVVTVEGGKLEEISSSSLMIRDGGGYGFSCGGNFSDYMDMKTRIDDLRYKNKSPLTTVKGIYAEGTNGKPSLKSCVLIDLKR